MTINLASGESAIATDQYGNTHLVWVTNGFLWHSIYDTNAEQWVNARAITVIGNETVNNLHLVTSGGLINNGANGAPGLAVVYQQGTGNNSDFFYTAAQYGPNQTLQWLNTPVQLTQDQVGDLNPSVQVYQPTNLPGTQPSDNTASVVVLGEKVNIAPNPNLSNQQTGTVTEAQEGSNLYNLSFTVNANQFTATATTPPTVPASYVPEDNLVQNGIIQGLPQVLIEPPTNTNENNTVESLALSTNAPATSPALTTSASASSPTASGYSAANHWNTALYYRTGLGDYEASLTPTGFIDGLTDRFMSRFFLQGVIKGSGDYNDTNLNLFLASRGVFQPLGGTKESRIDWLQSKGGRASRGESAVALRASLYESVNYRYSAPGDLIPSFVANTVGTSIGVTFPVFEMDGLKVSFSGSVGLLSLFSGVPKSTAEIDTLGPIIGLLGAAAGTGLIGVETYGLVASPLLSTKIGPARRSAPYIIAGLTTAALVSFLADEGSYSNVDTTLYFPNFYGLLLGVAGLRMFNVNAQAGLFITFSDNLSTKNIDLLWGIPMRIGVQIGPINAGFSYAPHWQWPIVQNNTETSPSPSLALAAADLSLASSEDTGTAAVVGALVTIDLGSTLNPAAIPSPEDFTITETTPQGPLTYNVANVIVNGSTVQLQLVQPIAPSSNTVYTSINDPNPTVTPNPIQVAYTGSTLEYSDGSAVNTFTDTVVNNTPATLSYAYNPLNGNSANYASATNLIGAGLYFGNGTNTNSTNQVLLVFNQNLQGNPSGSDFSLQSNGVSYSISSVSLSANTLLITTTAPIPLGNSVLLGYNGNSLQGTQTNALVLPFSNALVKTQSSVTPLGAIVASNNTLTLSLNQAPTATPNASDFTVQSNGVALGVSEVSLTGNTLTLTTTTTLSSSQSYTIVGPVSGTQKIALVTPVTSTSLLPTVEGILGQDSTPSLAPTAAGNQLLASWIASAPPLTPIAGFANGDNILLNFVSRLSTGDSTDNLEPNQFTVSLNGGSPINPQTVQIDGNAIVLQLANGISATDAVQVSYVPLSNSSSNPYLTDAQGTQLWLPSFTTYNPNLPPTDLTPPANTAVNPPTSITIANVTGAYSAGESPTLLSAVAVVQDNNSNLLTLTFDALLANQVPAPSEFGVTVNGQAYNVSSVGIYNNTVQLTVTPPTNQTPIGQTSNVSLSYQGTTLAANSNYGGGSVSPFNSPVQTAAASPTTVVKYALGPSGNSFADTPSAIAGVNGLNLYAVAGQDPQSKNNVIVWVNVDSSQIPTSLLPGQIYDNNQSQIINDSLQNTSVYYALQQADNTWTLAAPIALNQAGSNNQLTLGLGPNNQLMAAWLNTQDNNETTLYYALLNNGVWSAPQAILSGVDPDPLTELAIAQVGGQPAIFATQTIPASYSELTSEEGPVIFFALDEPSGSTSANNLGILGGAVTATYNGNVTLGETGALWNPQSQTGDPNPAALFSEGASLTITNPVGVTGQFFSLDLWFKVTDLSQGALNLVGLTDILNLGLNSAGTLAVEILDETTPVTLTAHTATPVNQWNYVALTYSGANDTISLYLNGAPVATQGNLSLSNPGSTTLTLAGTAGTSVYLDEVGIYDSTLSYSPLPTSLNDVDFATVTAPELQQILFGQGSNAIGEKYAAQYNPPVSSGPDTQYVVWNGSGWHDQPQSITPFAAPVATALSDANNPVWDVVSAVANTAAGAVYPNGLPDEQFFFTLNNYQNNQITGIQVTANGQTWAAGNNGNTPLTGKQLGVVQGTSLLNPRNPNNSKPLNHWVLGSQENYFLFVDNNGAGQITNATVTVYFADSQVPFSQSNLTSTNSAAPITSSKTPGNTEPTNINPSQVLGIGTVTENNDASLSTIDSGLVINTNNPNIGYGITSGSFTQNQITLGNGQKVSQTDVAVMSRGYTNQTGAVVNNATVQILFGNGGVMTGAGTKPLTATDLSGNPGGVLITGLPDGGQAKVDVPVSLTTGDLNGDGYDELIIGNANNNTVYILYGSYLNSLASNSPGTIINFSNTNPTATSVDSTGQATGSGVNLSNSDYAIVNAPSAAGNDGAFGYTLAVGNFDGTTGLDVAIGAPNQNSSQGAVYLASYDANTGGVVIDNNVLTGSSEQTESGFGAALAVSHYGGPGQASTFNGTQKDILLVGAPGYTVTITNAWNGIDGFSSSGQSIYPTTSTSVAGAVYGFFVSNNGLDTTWNLLLVGPDTSSAITGTAGNDLVGSAITLADYNGDGIQDLAIAAPGGDNTNGQVYVLAGGNKWTSNPNVQAIGSLSNLIINQSIPNAQIGELIASPGDINQDGYQDLLITAPQLGNATGQSYLLFGSSSPGAPLSLEGIGQTVDLNPTATDNKSNLLLNGSYPFQLTGQAAAGAGYVNGNPSLILSAPFANQLYTVYGHPWLADDGSLKLTNLSGDNGFVIDGDLYSVATSALTFPTGQSTSTTPALLNDQGTFYLAYVGNNNQIYLTSSSNQGQSWSSALQLPSGMTTSVAPSLAFYNNTLYLAYVGENKEINVTYSTDNGQTWSSQYTLGQYSAAGVSLVVYQNQLLAVFVSTESTSDILYVYSDNPQSSSSWSTDYSVANPSGSSGTQQASSTIAATVANNTLYLAYNGLSPAGSLYVTATTSNNLSNLTWDYANNAIGTYYSVSNPGIAVVGDTLYTTFFNNGQVYFVTSTNGQSWTRPQSWNEQTSTFAPPLLSANGVAYLGLTQEGSQGESGILLSVPAQTVPLLALGNDVVMLGDVNGDGFADVLTGGSPFGCVLAFGDSTQDLVASILSSNNLIITVNGAAIQQLVNIGDYNGDGLSDFGVLDSANHLYVVFGSSALVGQGTLSLNPSTSQFIETGGESQITGGIGDFNGDGYDDFLLLNWIHLGGATFSNKQGVEIQTSGVLMSPVGDINGDGYSDLVQPQSQLEISTSLGYGSTSSFNSLNLFLGNASAKASPQAYITSSAQPFYGTLNGKDGNYAGDFNGDGIADAMISTAQPVGLLVVETSNSAISYAYFDPFLINWQSDSQVSLNVQTTTHTHSTSGETMALASLGNNWYFSHSENYVYWLSGADINQSGENQFGTEYDYANPQLVTLNGNLYMIVAGWKSNDPYISLYNSTTQSWGPPDPSTEYDSLTNSITSTNGNPVVSAGIGSYIYLVWTHDNDLYYCYWDTNTSTLSQINNQSLSSILAQSPNPGDNNPLSLTAVNGVLYLALYDDNGDAWMTNYDTTASSASWTSAAAIEYVQGSTQVKAEENSITLMGLNGQVYASWYDTDKITQQSQEDNTEYVYLAVYNPAADNPSWSNSLQLYNTASGAGLDITGNGDFPGLTPFVWTGMTSIVTGNTEGNANNVITINGLSGLLPFNTTNNPTLSNYSSLGDEITYIGDINADGYDDILINSPFTALTAENTTDGAVAVIFGNDNPEPLNLAAIAPLASTIILNFNQTLNTSKIPELSQFFVGNGFTEGVTVIGVQVTANSVILTLGQTINLNQITSVKYSYSSSTSGNVALTNSQGQQISNFTAATSSSISTPAAPTLLFPTGSGGNNDRGFIITGLPNSQAGISVSGGGDINGDGFSDFLIGAPGNNDNLTYAIFGSDFNDTVNQTGTIGDDVMVGTATGESFLGNQGDDQIYTNGGLDVVYAGPGGDQVTVTDAYFRRLDGGTGIDTLFFEGYNGQAWNLTTLSPGLRLRDFEVLVTEGYGANLLTLNSLTVTQLSSDNTLVLFMDGVDTLSLSADFSARGTVYQNNQTFQLYQSSQSAATLLLNPSGTTVTYTAPGTNSPVPVIPSAGQVPSSLGLAETAAVTSSLAVSENVVSNEVSSPTQLFLSNPKVSELSGEAQFTIQRTGDLNKSVWVTFATQDGSGKAGDRYTPTAGQVIFAPGETTQTVTVPIPNNGRYVGSREFGLAVTLAGETTDPNLVPDAWEAAIATPQEQIRRWHRLPGEKGDSVRFDITSTNSPDHIVTLDLKLDGMVVPQIWHPATEEYDNIPFASVDGISDLQDIDGDKLNDLYHLRFEDGSIFDGDGLINGLVALDFKLAQLKPVDVPTTGGGVMGTEGNDYLNAQASSGTNRLEGLAGLDVLLGSPQRDVLLGGDGNDQLFGYGGVDKLFGDAGNDLLDGGAALDFLYGGTGADNFVLRAGDGPDRVMDFNAAEGDLFVLDNLRFGDLSFNKNQILLGTDILAIAIDATGQPVTNFANHPQWFVTI